jgi:hypothetical protein
LTLGPQKNMVAASFSKEGRNMAVKLAVAIVHGVGRPEASFAEGTMEGLRRRFRPSLEKDAATIFFCGPSVNQSKIYNRRMKSSSAAIFLSLLTAGSLRAGTPAGWERREMRWPPLLWYENDPAAQRRADDLAILLAHARRERQPLGHVALDRERG